MPNKLYTDLLKTVLLDLHRINQVEYTPAKYSNSYKSRILKFLNATIRPNGYHICTQVNGDYQKRLNGLDWPLYADSMIGLKRMDNIEYCVDQIIKDNIEGDFIETGVWRGGASIFMNALIHANNLNKNVWVADSFEGLPKPNDNYPADAGDTHYKVDSLAVSLDTVKANFEKYNLLTDNVMFLKGWFKDTLPVAPIEKLSLVRLDGDMYESTMDGLTNLYPKLSIGGFIIIDDYNAIEGCLKAVEDYRKENNINDPIIQIDGTGVFWRKER